MKRSILLVFLFSLVASSIFPIVRDIVESIKQITVKSITQKIINQEVALMEGDVEVLVDDKLHLWADMVTINKTTQIIEASSPKTGYVQLEGEGFFLLAKKLILNFDTRTVVADEIKIHLSGRYIAADRAEKLSAYEWRFDEILYTACEKPLPHWSVVARRARLKKYVIHIHNLLLKLGAIPVFFLPRLVVPTQNQSRSGFLMPKFYYDKQLGFGLHQRFYWDIAPGYDSTFGIKWKEKKGYVVYNEFRRGHAPESYTIINSKYAREKNAFAEKRNEIRKTSDHRYWIDGQHFQPLTIGDLELKQLMRVDFGTDKQIDYDFFNKTDALDNRFDTRWLIRWHDAKQLVTLSATWEKFFREQFVFLNKEKKNETEDKFEVVIAPHLSWDSAFHSLGKLFNYRHELFIDRAFFHRRLRLKTYQKNQITSASVSHPLSHASTTRWYYEGLLQKTVAVAHHRFRFNFFPNVQVRSKLQDDTVRARRNVIEGRLSLEGAYRAFFCSQIQWAFPELVAYNDDYSYRHHMQGILSWEFVPRFTQDHWYHADEWDRVFPRNELRGQLRNDWYFNDLSVDVQCSLGYEFFPRSAIFPLRRSSKQSHMLPFQLRAGVACDFLYASLQQEFDPASGTILSSGIDFTTTFRDVELYLHWLYQDPSLQRSRELLADLPSFVLVGMSMPFGKEFRIGYGSEFYTGRSGLLGIIKDPIVSLHRIKFDYAGHCYGFSLGFEEKRYRQQGVIKGERAYFFAFKLSSLGSFAKRFKQEPIIVESPNDYYAFA